MRRTPETPTITPTSGSYAVSAATGNPIVNQFDDADLNRYSGSETKVTYLSRSDWMGTWPASATVVQGTEQMAADSSFAFQPRTNGVYGPAANIHRNAYCGRNYEYFSEDAFLSGAMMAPEVAAIQSQGVYAFMKHFAINHQETHRAGVMVWANEQTLREAYLDAFEPAVTQGHIKGAMTIMNRIGAVWGGAHHGLLTGVLRDEWGFDGFVIKDYSSNSNFTVQTQGLAGGSDLWDGFAASDIADKSSDPYVCQLMRQAIHRILYVQANSSAINGIASSDRVVSILTWWQAALIGIDIALAALTAGSIVMLVLSKRKQAGAAPAKKDEK